jgi:hypothetical protein
VRAARREAEHGVSRCDRPAVDDARFLDHADREPGEVVLAFGVHAGHLGGLAADQRAAGELAAVRDALDDALGDVDVQLPARVVVEEEQRLGALHEDVVDAHRDQVLADRVVPAERERELELGADAVGAGDQHRLAEALADLDERAEAADAGEHLRAHRALRVRLDALDQRVARVDVDAGVSVRESGGAGGVGGRLHRVGAVVGRRKRRARRERGKVRRPTRQRSARILPEMDPARPDEPPAAPPPTPTRPRSSRRPYASTCTGWCRRTSTCG